MYKPPPTAASSSRKEEDATNTKEEDATNTKSNLKTISKSSVYLPLVAYDHKNAQGKIDPEAYMASRKSLPNSIQEKYLAEFWHRIGVDYHRSAPPNQAKNNGGKPISLLDMEERIRSRAVTLVGGGIHTSWDKTTSKAVTAEVATADDKTSKRRQLARKRKRESNHLMHFATKDGSVGQFLQELNGLWNDYMHKLLHFPPKGKTSLQDFQNLTRDTKLWARVTASVTQETAQLVGAKVRVKACRHCPNWVGRIGYVVGTTKNTWNVMVQDVSRKRRRRKGNKKKPPKVEPAGDENVESSSALGWQGIVVPKLGSALSLLISIQTDNKEVTARKHSDQATPTTTILAIDIRQDR